MMMLNVQSREQKGMFEKENSKQKNLFISYTLDVKAMLIQRSTLELKGPLKMMVFLLLDIPAKIKLTFKYTKTLYCDNIKLIKFKE